jgi:hypothetical protein
MNTKGKLVFDWNEIDGDAVVHTDCLGLENSLSQQADNPAQQLAFSHSLSAARRDSFFYYTTCDFQNIRNLRFLSDIAWSISIHTDKKEIEQCVLCVYLVSWDVFTKAFVS